MASVASTYARAFADVVFAAHLDAARASGGLRQIAALLNRARIYGVSGRIPRFPPSRNGNCWT